MVTYTMLLKSFITLHSALSIDIIASPKVVHFEENNSGTDISFIMLSDRPEVPLPDLFILCTSHKQSTMDKRGFYHIYGEDGQPWMMTYFGTGPDTHNSVGLWGSFGMEWIYFGEISQPKLYFWYHMCHRVDTSQGLISVSVNGDRLATDT